MGKHKPCAENKWGEAIVLIFTIVGVIGAICFIIGLIMHSDILTTIGLVSVSYGLIAWFCGSDIKREL
jgi:hypothetical protein